MKGKRETLADETRNKKHLGDFESSSAEKVSVSRFRNHQIRNITVLNARSNILKTRPRPNKVIRNSGHFL